MKHKQDRFRHRQLMPTFTLIELLVVIAIIAVLAALLLPTLARVRYKAKVVVCAGQLKQVGMAWTSYANDYDGYWPDFGDPTPDSTSYNDGDRPKSMTLANKHKGHDLRPTLRSYLGAPLNEMMKCPLASPKWTTGIDEGSIWYRHYDIDNYNLGGLAIVQSTYQLYPTGHGGSKFHLTSKQMRRVGDEFVPKRRGTAVGHEFNVLASDIMLHKAPRTSQSVLSTHRPLGSAVDEGGNYQNNNTAWVLPAGVFSTANYLSDDGSLTSYPRIGYHSSLDGTFLTTGDRYNIGFYLPEELAK